MAFDIQWRNSAKREFRNLDHQIRPRILSAVEGLAATPHPVGSIKLQGAEHTYRLRIGNYRVVYEVADEVKIVTIVRVRHRREVYR